MDRLILTVCALGIFGACLIIGAEIALEALPTLLGMIFGARP